MVLSNIDYFLWYYIIIFVLSPPGIFYWGTHSVQKKNVQVVLRLFRAPLLIILFLFLIGINIYGWRSSGVNHVLIFEIDPRNHLTEQHLIEIAAIFGKEISVIWKDLNSIHFLLDFQFIISVVNRLFT